MLNNKEYSLLKSKFLESYANVPEPLRKEIIAMVNNETFSWHTARAEIMNDTKNARLILEHLHKMEVI